MTKTDLGSIRNQPDLTRGVCRRLQPIACDRFIPFPPPDGGIVQKATRAANDTEQIRAGGNLGGDRTLLHRAALKDGRDEPSQGTDWRDTLLRAQLQKSLTPNRIQSVDRHLLAPELVFELFI